MKCKIKYLLVQQELITNAHSLENEKCLTISQTIQKWLEARTVIQP